MQSENFVEVFEESVKRNWDSIAITETSKRDIQYSGLAKDIEWNHQFWTETG